MSIGSLTGLNTIGLSLLTYDSLAAGDLGRLRPSGAEITRDRSTEDESAVATWSRLEDLRRQRAEAQADFVALPRVIARLQAAQATMTALSQRLAQATSAEAQAPVRAEMVQLVRGLKEDCPGQDQLVDERADADTMVAQLTLALNGLQVRWQQAPARVTESEREMVRLRARLRAFEVDYDDETGCLSHTRTGQSIDPVDLVSKLWDQLKENYREDRRRREAKDRLEKAPSGDGLNGMLALLASMGESHPQPVRRPGHDRSDRLDPPDRQVRAYVKTQVVVAGGTMADGSRRLYEGKRAVMCDEGDVAADGLVSVVADTLVIGMKGSKALEGRSPNRPGTGSAAFAALVA
jgi:hypothetical protein